MASRFCSVSRRCGFQSLILMLGAAYLLTIYVFHYDLQHSSSSDGDWAQIGGDAIRQQNPVPRRHGLDDERQLAFDALRHGSGPGLERIAIRREELMRRELAGVGRAQEADRRHGAIPSVPFDQRPKKTFLSSLHESNIPTGCQDVGVDDEFRFREIASSVHIYSAYWDSRPNDFDNRHNGTFIRMMAIIRGHSSPLLNCSFETKSGAGTPLTSRIHYYEMCENHGRAYGGFILSCPVPDSSAVSACSVTVTLGSADSRTAEKVRLRIRTIEPIAQRRDFTVCVPPIFGSVNSRRLVEFLEMSRIVGADHVTLYDFNMSEELEAVVEYFKAKGFVSVVPWKLDASIDSAIWYHGQIVAIQDCLYRSMSISNFVAFNDVDEVVAPQTVHRWSEMVHLLDDPKRCAFQFKAAFFRKARDEPGRLEVDTAGLDLQSMTMFERTSHFDGVRTKCIVKAYSIFEKGIHHVSKPIWADLEVHRVDTGVARLHHYRPCLHGMGMNCNDYEEDRTMLRYRAELVSAVNSTKHSLKDVKDL